MRIVLFFILSLSNSIIKGGLIETILGVDNISGLRYTFAIMYGLAFAYVTSNPLFGVLMAVAMFVGSVWSLPIQNMLKGHWWPMTQRGMVYALPLMVTTAYFYGYAALWFLPAFFLMFPAYYGPKLLFDHIPFDKIVNRHTMGEVLYGDLLCLPILFI